MIVFMTLRLDWLKVSHGKEVCLHVSVYSPDPGRSLSPAVLAVYHPNGLN